LSKGKGKKLDGLNKKKAARVLKKASKSAAMERLLDGPDAVSEKAKVSVSNESGEDGIKKRKKANGESIEELRKSSKKVAVSK
jgi:hypothetical protein